MENKVTVNSLAPSLAQSSGKTKKVCEDFLREFFKIVAEVLENGESIRIKGFGAFKIIEMESRTGVNVATGEKQEISPFKKVVFTPAKELAAVINSPFEEFESVEIDDEIPDDIFEEEDIEDEEIREAEVDRSGKPIGQHVVPGDEDRVSDYRLEEGSAEEGEDDEITYEAYTEPDTSEEHIEGKEPPAVESEKIDSGSESMEEDENETEIVLPVYDYEPEHKSRFGTGFLIGSLSTLVACVVIFMLGCFFDWWPVSFSSPGELKEIARQELPVDTEEVKEETPEEVPPASEPVYDTVSTTRYLTTIAREHYGNFNFWPYIYLENAAILGHPDRITPGTRVVVPDLSKYGVDPNNKEDVAEAKKKGLEIYARYK